MVDLYVGEVLSCHRVTEAYHHVYIGHGVIGRVTYLLQTGREMVGKLTVSSFEYNHKVYADTISPTCWHYTSQDSFNVSFHLRRELPNTSLGSPSPMRPYVRERATEEKNMLTATVSCHPSIGVQLTI
jgi:hypothetical protein